MLLDKFFACATAITQINKNLKDTNKFHGYNKQ